MTAEEEREGTPNAISRDSIGRTFSRKLPVVIEKSDGSRNS